MRFFLTCFLLIGSTIAAQSADSAAGQQAFKVCTACHMVGPNAKNRIGPALNGVAGRKWGSVEGFSYSENLTVGKDAGKVWDDAALNDYLEEPKRLAPQGKMAFAGVKDATKREDIIAYLKQFDATGVMKTK